MSAQHGHDHTQLWRASKLLWMQFWIPKVKMQWYWIKYIRFTQVCSFEELCFSIRVLLHSLSYSSSLLPINHPWLASSWIWIQILINPCTFRISTKQLSLSSVATRAGGGRPHRFINTQGIFRVIFESLFFSPLSIDEYEILTEISTIWNELLHLTWYLIQDLIRAEPQAQWSKLQFWQPLHYLLSNIFV